MSAATPRATGPLLAALADSRGKARTRRQERTPTMEDTVGPKGRPRDPKTTTLLQAVALELAYAGGIANATVERIAEHSGVAKTTIYRRWPNAASIVMDGFLDEIGPLVAYDEKSSIVATV
ncbi:MAG: TetR/AcrR family transcriptional regulator [Comamonadaceae bacterium]|nr:MAG: TetR/AcrR family transcriptional regulator [Comamonadaceae bacterium]